MNHPLGVLGRLFSLENIHIYIKKKQKWTFPAVCIYMHIFTYIHMHIVKVIEAFTLKVEEGIGEVQGWREERKGKLCNAISINIKP